MRIVPEIGGIVGVIVWIMIHDVAGGIAGLAAGSMAVACVEPLVGGLAGCVMLVAVPLGLCAGALLGVILLAWIVGLNVLDSPPALRHG